MFLIFYNNYIYKKIVSVSKDIYLYFNNYKLNKLNKLNKKNKKKQTVNNKKDSVYFFLNSIKNKWKKNKLYDMELYNDILILYYKYNMNNNSDINLNKEISKNIEEQNTHMKYYILGWYIYQQMENKNK
jgi:hypothetical protein